MKEKLHDFIDKNSKPIVTLADHIFDNPELGTQEYEASKLLTNLLKEKGFDVEMPIGGFDTAFRATYQSGNGGPSIGLLCEYDALENLGHACGHHMQGPSIVYAAIALKEIIKSENYKIVVYGTPAEETISGKVHMIKNGCFKDIDLALMMHGSPTTTTDVKSLALSNFKINFHGKSSHAALKPEEGRSALDGVLMLANGIEYLREHIKDDVRIHYSITNGGGPANVVPSLATLKVSIRSYDRVYLDSVIERFKKIVQGAGLITETRPEIIHEKSLNNKIPVIKLNEILMGNAELVNAPNIRPPREKTGSTDFGNLMYLIPGSCIRISFVPEGSSSHSEEYIKAGKSKESHDATIYAAKILADTAYDIIINPELLVEIQDEFNKNKKNNNQ